MILVLLLLSGWQTFLVSGATALFVSVTPSPVTLGVGQSQVFTANVAGGTEPYHYQWYLNGNALSGVTSSTYTYTASATGFYSLYVKVTDAATSQENSNTVNITVSAIGAVSVTEVTLEPLSYKPAKLTFNYQYTHNHTIGSITTVGNSAYKHSGGPTFMEFIADDIDDYSFTVELQYSNMTSQTVLIGLFSGTLAPQGFAVTGSTDIFRIHVRLRVTEQPSYPSEEAVAKEVVRQVERDLVLQQQENQKLIEEVRNTSVVVSTLSVTSIVLVIVCFVLAALTFRTRKPLEG